ncbi:MAG: hypothetical protein Ta2E_05290 [Mycoplasmoidaceae bacterium]|nr:MAG: hypothetical protein Ta2E_05290 [Mycoplasmoidaceae bacterium]
MFGIGKNKTKEKKPKWWKTNDKTEFQMAAGSNFKIARGFAVLLIVGIFLFAIAGIIRSTPAIDSKSVKPLIWSGAAFCITAIIGIFITVFFQARASKRKNVVDAKQEEYKKKLNEVQKQYQETVRKTTLEPATKKLQEFGDNDFLPEQDYPIDEASLD